MINSVPAFNLLLTIIFPPCSVTICFAIAKGTAFLAPILAIRIMPLADYGMLETSYAWGQQLTMLAVLGIPAAYPYFILKRRETEMQAYFWLYGLFLCLCVCPRAASVLFVHRCPSVSGLGAIFGIAAVLSAISISLCAGAPFPHSTDTGVGTGKSPQPFSACTAGALSRRTAQCSAKHPAFERGGPKANG